MASRGPNYIASSANPFVNGSRRYQFVWGRGNELCGRCGELGHLPRYCTNAPLQQHEQRFLLRLIREETDRAKAARGLHWSAPLSALAPGSGAGSASMAPPVPSSHQGGHIVQGNFSSQLSHLTMLTRITYRNCTEPPRLYATTQRQRCCGQGRCWAEEGSGGEWEVAR